MNRKEKAVQFFSQKLHCSQSVLAVFAGECGISEEMAFKPGSCFEQTDDRLIIRLLQHPSLQTGIIADQEQARCFRTGDLCY